MHYPLDKTDKPKGVLAHTSPYFETDSLHRSYLQRQVSLPKGLDLLTIHQRVAMCKIASEILLTHIRIPLAFFISFSSRGVGLQRQVPLPATGFSNSSFVGPFVIASRVLQGSHSRWASIKFRPCTNGPPRLLVWHLNCRKSDCRLLGRFDSLHLYFQI